jgi:flagellar hook protein FlgE
MVNTVYNAAISGLQAASLKLRVSANNVANANTDGYQRQQVTTQAGTYGVEVKVEKVGTIEPTKSVQASGELRSDAPSNVDVAEELLEMKAAQNLFEANLKTLNTNDNMLGRILDIEA